MDTDVKDRPSAVQRILKHPGPRPEPEVEEAANAYQDATGHRREAIMLDLRLADGAIESFAYMHLWRVRLSGGALTLRFGKTQVTIEGRNLHMLRDAVTEHKARFVQEGTEAEEGVKPEDAIHIERIAILDGEEE